MTEARRAPRTLDAAIAVGCWVVCGAVLLTVGRLGAADPDPAFDRAPVGEFRWWLTLGTCTAQAVVLLWARRSPRVALLTVTGVPVLLAPFGPGPVYSVTSLATAVATFLAVTVVSGADLRVWSGRGLRLWLSAAAVLLAAGELTALVRSGQAGLGGAAGSAALQALSVIGVPLLIGLVVASRRKATAAHDRELQALARERDALVLAAVARERTAMARELHDIAAHHMSGIALMAAAIERQIDTEPALAKQSVSDVRSQSAAVLEDLRRLVGLLRDDDEATRSVQTLATLGDLVQRRRSAGMAVDLRMLEGAANRGLGAGIGPLAQLVAYRMVQEALANAALHAPGAPCVVEVDDRGVTDLGVTVGNAAPETPIPAETGGGFGLIGMVERADLVGAVLSYGDTEDGGWEVRLVIPREGIRPEQSDPTTSTDRIDAAGSEVDRS